MLKQWVEQCLELSAHPADFYSGARKIIRNVHFSFDGLGNTLEIGDCGFTQSKLTALNRLYRVEESIEVAKTLWDRRVGQDKYGSVGFHCYNHLIKNDPDKKSKRASVMGPCIQSVVLTYNRKETTVDCFYRTTELYKKFPADLVFLRDNLLDGFDFSKAPITRVNFHFANVTCHPMYFVTLLPLIDYPILELNRLKKVDPYFFTWVVKWTARYICPEHHRGIAKFAQALRVQMDAKRRIPADRMSLLVKYFTDNHPGYKRGYVDPEEEDDAD